jgi:Family of unknown function (DUF5709)
MSSSFSGDQLQPDETLDERGVDDVLDEGMSPPERPSREVAHGMTPADEAAGETLDERLEQEEPDPSASVAYDDPPADAGEDDYLDDGEVGDVRTGRLAEEEGEDDVADDVGIDGGAASAEEAAVHTVPEDEL